MTFTDRLKQEKAGATFSVDAESLGMSNKDFHDLAKGWVENGGGDGFSLVKEHVESSTGYRYIDLVSLKKDGT